jgi:hypothetical protein
MVAVFDRTLQYFRTERGFRRLWYSPVFSAIHRSHERRVDLAAVRSIGAELVKLGLLEVFDAETEHDFVMLWSQLGALTELAFRLDDDGHQKTLEKTRAIIRAQVAEASSRSTNGPAVRSP